MILNWERISRCNFPQILPHVYCKYSIDNIITVIVYKKNVLNIYICTDDMLQLYCTFVETGTSLETTRSFKKVAAYEHFQRIIATFPPKNI